MSRKRRFGVSRSLFQVVTWRDARHCAALSTSASLSRLEQHFSRRLRRTSLSLVVAVNWNLAAMTMMSYETIIFVSWAAFLLVWGVSAFFVKPDVRGGGWQRFWVLRVAAAAIIIFAAVRLGRNTGYPAAVFFSHPLFTPTLILGWTGALLTAIGISFAIWARVNLGRNWSSRPAMKEQHELVTTGPYAYVRHPIYTGILLAALGTAILSSTLVSACSSFYRSSSRCVSTRRRRLCSNSSRTDIPNTRSIPSASCHLYGKVA